MRTYFHGRFETRTIWFLIETKCTYSTLSRRGIYLIAFGSRYKIRRSDRKNWLPSRFCGVPKVFRIALSYYDTGPRPLNKSGHMSTIFSRRFMILSERGSISLVKSIVKNRLCWCTSGGCMCISIVRSFWVGAGSNAWALVVCYWPFLWQWCAIRYQSWCDWFDWLYWFCSAGAQSHFSIWCCSVAR